MAHSGHDSAGRDNHPEFSVVVSSYFEEKSLREFYSQLKAALDSLGRSYEIIFVNDGSTDGTFALMETLFDEDESVACVLDLMKNAGQLAGWTAGIVESVGDTVLLIDSDLQLDPGELPLLVAEYDKGFDLVSGYRKNRKDPLLRVLPSKLANIIMRQVSGTTIRDFGCTFKLYNAKVLRAFNFGPFNRFNTAVVISKIGRYTEVPVTHHPRKYGKSGWTFRGLWQFNMENVVNMPYHPFQIMATVCFFAACAMGLRVAIGFFSSYTVLESVSNGLLLNASVIALLLTVSVLSLIGEFTLRSFRSLQRVPAYIIRSRRKRETIQ